MESPAQALIADLPRAGDPTEGVRGIRRPTTPLPSMSGPPSAGPYVAALGLRMHRLERTLAALTEEHEAHDRDAADDDGCRAVLEAADGLLVASARRDIRGTIWQLCHPSKCARKCDLLRRHAGIVQHAYGTAGERCRDAVRPLAELCERAERLGDDARQVFRSIDELNNLQECKKAALNAEIRMRMEAWSRKTLRLAALRKREQEMRRKEEWTGSRQAAWHGTRGDGRVSSFPGPVACKHVAGTDSPLERDTRVLSSLAQEIRSVATEVEMLQADVESLQQGRDAMNQAEGLLVAKLVVRMEVFRAKYSELSAELQNKEKPLEAAGERCLGIAAELDALKESSFGELVSGVHGLARGIAVEREKEKKKREQSWKTCKSARRPHTSIASRLVLRQSASAR